MKQYRIYAAIILTAYFAGCQREARSAVCQTLVASSAESICTLPDDLPPMRLVGYAVFDVTEGQTLREKLESLGQPESTYEDTRGTRWYVFRGERSKYEVGCVHASSVDVDACFWHLRSSLAANIESFDLSLRNILLESRQAGFRDGRLALIGVKRSDGSQQSVTMTIETTKTVGIDWYDPVGTKGFSIASR